MSPEANELAAYPKDIGQFRIVQTFLCHVGCQYHLATIQQIVVFVKDTLPGAVRRSVGQGAAVDDDARTTLESRRLFAEALRAARLRYGRETGQGEITQKQFAIMLGISGDRPEERYRLYEGAKREPPLWVLAALRRVTGFSLDDIVAQLPAGRPLGPSAPGTRQSAPPNQPDSATPTKPRAVACIVPVAGVRRRR